MFECRVLGSVEVAVDGRLVDIGPAKQRCVLAVLLADANTAVPADRLVDRVWGENSPPRVRNALYSYLARLRIALEPTPARIATRSGGYVLTVDEQSVDLHRFRQLASQARAATSDEQARRLLERAMRLWRGEAFEGLDTAWLNDLREILERERFEVRLDHHDLELRAGRHTALVSTLATLADQHPLDERLAGQLMLALHRNGRQADALRVFADVRRRISEELGLDPGRDLRSLHERVLADDPGLAVPKPVRRNGLPGDVADFTGRGAELDQLLSMVPGDSGGAVVISAIDGMAGVGKTALAVHLAHSLADRYPDAQLFLDLHAHTAGRDPVDPGSALDTLLRGLGVPGASIPADLDARAGMWRTELADRKAVVVLDNAVSAAQVRPLLPGTSSSLTLVTSRRRLLDLDAARVLSLDVLPERDAIGLLEQVIGAERVQAEPEAVHELVRLCGYLPLALRIAAARLRTRPTWTVERLNARLREGRGLLGELGGDRGVAPAFTQSYRDLSAGQQRMFRWLGLAPGPDTSARAAASLLGTDVDTAGDLLEDLVDAHLLEQPMPDRYRFHDLLRAYATELVADDPAELHAAQRRMLDHYLHSGYAAMEQCNPTAIPITLAPLTDGVTPEKFESYDEAHAWLTREYRVLLAAGLRSGEDGFDTHTWQLARTLIPHQDRHGHWQDMAAMSRAALSAAVRLGDRVGQAHSRRGLAVASARSGDYDGARAEFEQALDLFRGLGDQAEEAWSHLNLSAIAGRQSRTEEALEHSRAAVALFEGLGGPPGLGNALNAVAWYLVKLGRFREAVGGGLEALRIARVNLDRRAEASVLDTIAGAHLKLGEHTQAVEHYESALALYRDLGERYYEADTLIHLGDAQHEAGDDARASWQGALDILDELGSTDADPVRARLDRL
ncbi:BTAD domain-containing putative transcriptional regulator [Lentzea sp. NPDC051838]|uniref:AfsR/SARP family transcriptional regulator n=1 Tax=Lentzea sp. NPDC051838 TaxID=3154849 RepID=UPI00344A36C9